ncbi:MAG: hypothetical protein AAFX07_12930 [Pseudomonadota bacterium]
MLRMFSFLPPIGSYVLAICALLAAYSVQEAVLINDPEADIKQVWLVGGIVAFLLAFGGFQKSLENRASAKEPRVSSADVMQKLTPTETGRKDASLDVPSPLATGPEADTPLGRLRAKSADSLNL